MKNLVKKIWWRVRFVCVDMWGMDPRVIAYTLLPWVRVRPRAREELLLRKGYFSWDEANGKFDVGDLTFSYGEKVPTGDVISIHLSNDPYIQKNFIRNPAFKLEGPYEKGGAQIKASDVVVDVGANIGLFSVLAARKAKRVIAFEPIPDAQEFLRENLTVNNVHNVEVAPFALGSKKDTLQFSVSMHDLGASSAVLTEGKEKKVSVQQTTLDDFVKEQKVEQVNFIKADIEGMERELLAGARETIKKYKPKLAICIYHRPDDPEIIEGIIRSMVPEYKIEKTKTKLYAWT